MARSFRKVVIVDPTDDDNLIEFEQLRLPRAYPEYSRPENFVKESLLRMDSTSGGRRCFSHGGINENHRNFETTLHLVYPAEVEQLLEWYENDPPVVKLSNDGVNFFWAIFLPGGCDPISYENNEDYTIETPALAAPFHNMVPIKLSILTTATAPGG